MKFKQLFNNKKCAVIGMVHLKALPGSPQFSGSIEQIVSKACKETETYLQNDLDGILIENMHDIPYTKPQFLGPETTATFARVCTELRKIIPKNIPTGVQVLAAANKEALAIAKACSLDFIRAEGFVFSHVADEGFIDANAGTTLRYRKQIEAENVLVLTDIKKKHSSHSITSDTSLVETAQAAEFFLSDGLILTGTATGDPANVNELNQLKANCKLPVIIGSGVAFDNLENYLNADALIIGSHFKVDGKWNNELDDERIRQFIKKIKNLLQCQ